LNSPTGPRGDERERRWPAAICAGIVGHVNLLLGETRAACRSRDAAGKYRPRHPASSARDADANVAGMYANRPRAAARPDFRKGFARLCAARAEFDAWLFHLQIGESPILRAPSGYKIALDHCGGLIGTAAMPTAR
jgi:hypothetical protein